MVIFHGQMLVHQRVSSNYMGHGFHNFRSRTPTVHHFEMVPRRRNDSLRAIGACPWEVIHRVHIYIYIIIYTYKNKYLFIYVFIYENIYEIIYSCVYTWIYIHIVIICYLSMHMDIYTPCTSEMSCAHTYLNQQQQLRIHFPSTFKVACVTSSRHRLLPGDLCGSAFREGLPLELPGHWKLRSKLKAWHGRFVRDQFFKKSGRIYNCNQHLINCTCTEDAKGKDIIMT